MGLFDGASPTGEEGSTAEVAKWLQAPIALVVDAGGMARSIAAIAHGFASFDPAIRLGAVIANRVGDRGAWICFAARWGRPSSARLRAIRSAATSPSALGCSASASALPEALLDALGQKAESWFSLDALVDLARSAPTLEDAAPSAGAGGAPRCRIAVAHDGAFHFYYADNLRRLEASGAEIVRFSPCRDRDLPAGVDGLYFGGGYPEAHAAELAANRSMREAVAAFAARGRPIYAECGGLMYLTRAIVGRDGSRHAMVGLFAAEARMSGDSRHSGTSSRDAAAHHPRRGQPRASAATSSGTPSSIPRRRRPRSSASIRCASAVGGKPASRGTASDNVLAVLCARPLGVEPARRRGARGELRALSPGARRVRSGDRRGRRIVREAVACSPPHTPARSVLRRAARRGPPRGLDRARDRGRSAEFALQEKRPRAGSRAWCVE